MHPLISVVLPAFNAASTVGRAVASVRSQTFDDWELLVVDDGSTDGTKYVAEAAAEGDPRIRVIRIGHGGVVCAHNAGLDHARGDFLARLDADDEMTQDRLRAQLAFMEAHAEIGVAGCLVAFEGDREAAAGYALHVDWVNSLLDHDSMAKNRFIDSPLAHPGTMIRREVIAQHGSYRRSSWPDDYDYWLRLFRAGVRFGKVPEILVKWFDSPGRMSRKDVRYSESAFHDCRCHYLADWLKHHGANGRPVFLWGAGRVTRRRFERLTEGGVALAGYIDVDTRKLGQHVGGLPVIGPDELMSATDCFVVGAVGTRGARDLIRDDLNRRGFVEGRDFIMAA